jgi:hypothetical protein
MKLKKTDSRRSQLLYSDFSNYLTRALNSEPALKVTTFIAGILIFSLGF